VLFEALRRTGGVPRGTPAGVPGEGSSERGHRRRR